MSTWSWAMVNITIKDWVYFKIALIKYGMIFFFVLISIITKGQEPDLIHESRSEKLISIDSVSFCSVKFKIPRECNDNEETDDELKPNCCSVTTRGDSGSLACYNGTSLFWDYTSTEKRAKEMFESIPPQFKRQMKSFHNEPITCYVLGKRVNGLKAIYVTYDGEHVSSIFAYGTINSQPVFIHIISSNEFKTNDDIPKGIRQIFRLTK